MADDDKSRSYLSFSAQLDEKISDLSNSLVGPSHFFHSNAQFTPKWQNADIQYNARNGEGYHNTSQLRSFFTNDGYQDTSADNENQEGSSDLSCDEELLKKKRAAAMDSLSQKRAASWGGHSGNSEISSGAVGSQAPPTQDTSSTTDQQKLAKTSAAAVGAMSPENEPSSEDQTNRSGRTDSVEENSHLRQIASAEDIDGLLAEGRVSAIGITFKSSTKDQPSSEGADITQRSPVPPSENSSQAASSAPHKHQINHRYYYKGGSDGARFTRSSVADEEPISILAENSDGAPRTDVKQIPPSGQEPRSDHKSYPERRIYEPPKRVLAGSSPYRATGRGDGSSAKPSIPLEKQSHSTMPSNRETCNEFSKLQFHEVEELKEWLVHTGYYDENYRRATLHRHKRIAALEREKEDLMREEMQERNALTKNNDLGPLFPLKHSFEMPSHNVQSSPSIPTPTFVPKVSTTSNTRSFGGTRKELSSGLCDEFTSSYLSPSSVSKRLYSDFDNDTQNERVEKMVRADANSKPRNKLSNEEAPDYMNEDHLDLMKERKLSDGGEPMMGGEDKYSTSRKSSSGWGNDSDLFIHDSRYPGDGGQDDSYEFRGSSLTWRGRGRGRGRSRGRGRGQGRGWICGRGRGRGRGREVSTGSFSREVTRSGFSNEPRGSQELNLAAGGVSYFLIKCLAYEMVDAAKVEGTWATQPKNIEKFTNAFENSRHVILIFSVNQSGAFQGYARMETQPGASGVAPPSWVKTLDMSLSQPFKICWYNTVNTMFRHVGYLKNPYNEDHEVTYARDGQEIEGECGRILCEILDKTMDFVSA
ncbi:hypothetical protein PAAG_02675 [Paracoccidioides lutzii Pb01]|uniref:YTH domain-containing protein n=1 Tax=Paracoccidioides lutzii (strain ATCC MYA-826 / Pb01) TaxID=502779 RepID=C1GVY0_PARBA|nr:hypothetical protein PAAG_02675 [Paracoccidioides lutzii Pb01]EEH40699.2 hypothetical protein PAAG_02675 [Paracoccidioides lutzii Pb01]